MSVQQSDKPMDEKSTERIVVALDASPNSVAALRAAVELASIMGVELEGLFVEDINLMYLCKFPNQQEVGSYTGAIRRLDDRALQRQLRALKATIRQAMAREAGRRPVRWTFQVRRGSVVTELLAASKTASMVSLGRASRSRPGNLGSTAQSVVSQSSRPVLILGDDGELQAPLTVIYTGSEAADRALRLAINLHRRNQSELRVLLWAGKSGRSVDNLRNKAEATVQQAGALASMIVVTVGAIGGLVSQGAGTVVAPRETASLVSEHRGATILVP